MVVDEISPGEPEDIARRLEARFESLYDGPPEGSSVAPGRVNLIGEHVDYNNGRCLPMALPHATYAALATRRDDRVRISSLQQESPWSGTVERLGPGHVTGWASYVAGVIWALREQGLDVPGLDILVDSRVPVGAGLSSSAALECSVAVGVCALVGIELSDTVRRDLATACVRAETEVAGAPTGGMDQTISLLGREGQVLLLDCRDWSTEHVPWALATERLTLLVIDTRAAHTLVDGGYASRRADCEEAARILGVESLREVSDPDTALGQLRDERLVRRTRHVLSEMARVEQAVDELRSRDFAALGSTFDASHASLRDDFEVSCAELDVAVATSRGHGALGARMTGGGFGGSAIALVPEDQVGAICEAVAEAFADRGWPGPGFLIAEPSAGARRVNLSR